MKKLNDETKVKLIYSGELALFAIVFAVLGILKLTRVMGYDDKRRIVFNWITVFGGCWGIADFIWAMVSKKRQKRISKIDKIVALPLSLYIITFDLISLIAKPADDAFYINMLGAAFIYVSVIYVFQAIYHYFYPIPGLFDDEDKKKEENTSVENVTENKEESTIVDNKD